MKDKISSNRAELSNNNWYSRWWCKETAESVVCRSGVRSWEEALILVSRWWRSAPRVKLKNEGEALDEKLPASEARRSAGHGDPLRAWRLSKKKRKGGRSLTQQPAPKLKTKLCLVNPDIFVFILFFGNLVNQLGRRWRPLNTPRRKEKEGRVARGGECARSVASPLYGQSAPTHGRSGECQRHARTEVESVREACETRVRRPATERERVSR